VFLGNSGNEDTTKTSKNGQDWISDYIASRYYKLPPNVSVKHKTYSARKKRTAYPQSYYLNKYHSSKGKVKVSNADVHWWILKNVDRRSYTRGHAGILHDDELYVRFGGHDGHKILKGFGIFYGYKNVVIYVEPHDAKPTISRGDLGVIDTNGNRVNAQELMQTWQSEFYQKMPRKLKKFVKSKSKSKNTKKYSKFDDKFFEFTKRFTKMFLAGKSPTIFGNRLVSNKTKTQGGTGGGGGGGGGGGNNKTNSAHTHGNGSSRRGLKIPNITFVNADNDPDNSDLKGSLGRYVPSVDMIYINMDYEWINHIIDDVQRNFDDGPEFRDRVEEFTMAVLREYYTSYVWYNTLPGRDSDSNWFEDKAFTDAFGAAIVNSVGDIKNRVSVSLKHRPII